MNILILGGNGYLGSKVVNRLVEEGEHYLVCTKRVTSDMHRLNSIIQNRIESVKFIPATIEAVEAVLEYTSFDWVLNMACNYGRSNVLYGDVIESNIEFPLKVLNMLVEKGTKNFLTIGTGLPDELNMYSFSKKMFSDFGKFYVKKHNVNFYNMRLEMFYGSDEPKDRFIPNLIHDMIEGKEINVTIGTQHRDIISIDDVVKSIFITMSAEWKGYFEIPVGTGIAPSISEIVDFIWEETGKKSIVHKGTITMRLNEPDCVANTILLDEFQWRPICWKDGLRNMICEIREEKEKQCEKNID